MGTAQFTMYYEVQTIL